MLSDLITSKSRVKLLNVFLASPYEMYHVREAVRRTGDEINAIPSSVVLGVVTSEVPKSPLLLNIE